MTMRVPSYYEVHHMFYFNLYSMNNDEEMRYLWTIPPHHSKEGIHILVEFDQIQQHSIPITHDRNTTNMTEHITAVTQMVSDESSMLYTAVNNDDDEVDESDGDDVVSSQSESNDDNDPEEGELQTPLNPLNPINSVTENIVPQWESSQWFSSARYDYTHSGAFLDMGSSSPIDDLVESGTIQLLDWNDFMTDIQLGMRLVDEVQTISAVLANDPEIPVSNIIQEVQVLFQRGFTNKRPWYARKFAIERLFGSWETTFNILPKYLQAVQDLNPRTVYEFLHHRTSSPPNYVFKLFFGVSRHV
ncbi:hypothetical protein M9H77_01466 [Catharanthus roseus]|uniref:Uncharacterized protein n=1 Tax=Catharanthus roseus TaxID=4058 RepID=A0ACC0C5M6_CATRO|nr:hypothetical protein M9H77_01466 [Catharanthus roseus]